MVKNDPFEGSRVLHTRMGKSVNYREIDNFTSFNNINILCKQEDVDYKEDSIKITIEILNHRQYPILFNNSYKTYIKLRNREDNELTFEQTLNNNLSINAHESAKLYFLFSFQDIPAGDYEFIFGITDGITDPSVNSKRYRLHL